MDVHRWTREERKLLSSLSSPWKIQEYLDSLRYNVDSITRSPRGVMATRRAHCFDGAFMAAAALEFNGAPPLLMDLRCNGDDDDHVLAVYRRRGLWGAVAKSNYTGCRFRDPVFRSLRELAMSYFTIYFNLAGRKTLREYSVTLDLRRVKDVDWRRTPDDVTPLGDRLNELRHFWLIPRSVESVLAPVDERTFRGETLGLDPKGAFKVDKSRL